MTDENPEIVSYSTFVRDLNESKVSEVDIFNYGREIDLTYETTEGVLRGTKGPVGLDNDELLSFTLSSQEVPFTVHPQEYAGSSSPFVWGMHLSSLIFFLIPILMLLVILRQSKTIKSLADALVKATESTKAESGDGGQEATRPESK